MYDEDEYYDEFEEALADCGVDDDGFCGHIGSEWCDWHCPISQLLRSAVQHEPDIPDDSSGDDLPALPF